MYTPDQVVPRNNIVFIKPNEEQSRKSEHGIYMPDAVDQEKIAVGTVLAIGPKVNDPMQNLHIAVGDTVVYGVYAGEDLKFHQDEKEVVYKLVPEDEVWAVIKK